MTCEWCGAPTPRTRAGKRFCSVSCANRATRRIRANDDPRVKRRAREVSAPGLNEARRKALLAQWIKQHRQCAYCDALADTLDHVLPLVRGGTNYEGNLVPACRRCNSIKGGLTVIEWRTGKRLPQMREQAQRYRAAMAARRKAKRAVQDALALPDRCALPGCAGWATTSSKYCTGACAIEANARRNRDRYRAAKGLPVDPTAPTAEPRTRPAFPQVSAILSA